MRSLAEFVKTALIGGVLVLVPIYLITLLLLKALAGVMGLVSPITQGLPETLPLRELLAILILIAACFVCGVAVRRSRFAGEERVRAYRSRRDSGLCAHPRADRENCRQGRGGHSVVLAEIEDALVPAFLIEECDDEHFAIFVPSVPTPAAGSIYIIAKARVHPVDVPFTLAISVIWKWGAGSSELLAGMKRARLRAT